MFMAFSLSFIIQKYRLKVFFFNLISLLQPNEWICACSCKCEHFLVIHLLLRSFFDHFQYLFYTILICINKSGLIETEWTKKRERKTLAEKINKVTKYNNSNNHETRKSERKRFIFRKKRVTAHRLFCSPQYKFNFCIRTCISGFMSVSVYVDQHINLCCAVRRVFYSVSFSFVIFFNVEAAKTDNDWANNPKLTTAWSLYWFISFCIDGSVNVCEQMYISKCSPNERLRQKLINCITQTI